MSTSTRPRRFRPTLDTLSLRLAPSGLCPMDTVILTPDLLTTPVQTSPMDTIVIEATGQPQPLSPISS